MTHGSAVLHKTGADGCLTAADGQETKSECHVSATRAGMGTKGPFGAMSRTERTERTEVRQPSGHVALGCPLTAVLAPAGVIGHREANAR